MPCLHESVNQYLVRVDLLAAFLNYLPNDCSVDRIRGQPRITDLSVGEIFSDKVFFGSHGYVRGITGVATGYHRWGAHVKVERPFSRLACVSTFSPRCAVLVCWRRCLAGTPPSLVHVAGDSSAPTLPVRHVTPFSCV